MKRIVLFLFMSVFAFSVSAIPSIPQPATQKGIVTTPGYCEIEVANQSHLGAWVDIQYDNGSWRFNNYVYPGQSLMIPLDYPGYCRHSYAFLNIYGQSHTDLLYSGYVYVGNTVTVLPALNKGKMRVKLSK